MADVCCPDEPKPEPKPTTAPSFSHGRSCTVIVKRRAAILRLDQVREERGSDGSRNTSTCRED
jgi:hypothetical protein